MYDKTITPAYEIVGKRKRLTGFIGELRDGDTLIHSQEYSTNSQAEHALNALTHDLLSDYFSAGLVDEPPVCATCDGDGTVRAYGHGDQDNGYAQTCPACQYRSCTDAEPATALLADCAAVIRATLGGPVANGGIVADLRRVEARLRSHGW